MMDHLPVGPAAQTGPELFRLRTLIALHPDDPVSFYMQPEWASAPAIKGGSGPDDPDFVAVRTGIRCTHSYLPGCRLTPRQVKSALRLYPTAAAMRLIFSLRLGYCAFLASGNPFQLDNQPESFIHGFVSREGFRDVGR